MTFHPFGKLVLAEKIDQKKKVSGIILPDQHEGRFWKVKIIDCGDLVNKDIHPGDICMSNPLPEIDKDPIDSSHPEWILLNEGNILGRWI